MSETTFFSESFNAEQVYLYIRKAFSDFFEFDVLMTPLMSYIVEQRQFFMKSSVLSANTLDQSYLDYYNFDSLSKEEKKSMLEKIRVIFIATKIYIASLCPIGQESMLSCQDDLFQRYPAFTDIRDAKEIEYLLIFRNMMHIGIRVIAGKPKMALLRAVERLEGSDNIYVTGSGQKETVTRRIAVYEEEGGEKLRKKKRTQEKEEEMALAVEQVKRAKKVEEPSFDEVAKLVNFDFHFDNLVSIPLAIPQFALEEGNSDAALELRWFEDIKNSFITEDIMYGTAGSAI